MATNAQKKQNERMNKFMQMHQSYTSGQTVTGQKDNDTVINSFLRDSQNYIREADSELKRMSWKDATDPEKQNTRNKVSNNISQRSKQARSILESSKDNIDPDQYKVLMEYLDDFDNDVAAIGKETENLRSYYSKWKSEEEYTSDYQNYVNQKRDREEKGKFDLISGQREIDDLEAERQKILDEKKSRNAGANGRPYAVGQQDAPDFNSYTTGYGITNNRPYAAGLQVQKEETPEDTRLREIDQLISKKKQYLNQAKRIQESEAYANTVKNVDFDRFDDYVKSDDALYNWINDEQFRDSYESNYVNPRHGSVGGSQNHNAQIPAPLKSEFARKGYDRMNANEIAIYNYYYAKSGKEAAQKYLDNIQETLNRRVAEDMYGGIKDSTAAKIVFGAAVGLNQFGSNVENFFNTEDDYIAQTAYQLAGGMVREDLADEGKKIGLLGGVSLGQIAYDTVSTTANMAPSILASYAVGAAAGTLGLSAKTAQAVGSYTGSAMMGISAAGGAYQQALNEGFDKDQARGYGILVGASEVVMEKFLGGISAVGGNALGINMTKNIANADTALKAIAKRLGGSMISEFGEEYLQEVLEPVFSNIMLKTDKEVKLISAEAIYSGILGMLTGAIMESPSAIYGEAQTASAGRKLKEAGGVDSLAKIGNTFAADTVAYKLAGKVNENTGAYTIGQLLKEVDATLTEQNVSEISEALVKEGVGEIAAKKYAQAFAYVVEGGVMPDSMVNAIESDTVLAKAAREVLIDSNTTWNQRTQGYNEVLKKLAMDKVTGKKSGKATPANDQQMTGKLTAEESAVVENADESSAETVSAPRVKEIVSMKNGTMKLRLEDGSVVDSGDASYSSDSEALVYETVAQMTNDVKVANVLVDSFHIQNKKSAIDAQVYAAGIDEAFRYGKSNIPKKELASSEFASKLTPAQQEFVYRMGQRSAGKQVAKNKATVKKSAKNTKEKTSGKVHFDRKGRTFDKTRETSLKTMEQLAAVLGTEFYVYESYVNEDGQRVYKDADGNEASAPNGFYDPETSAIHIDLNAGAEGNGTMIFTVAHELTHFIKHWSDDKFKVLANFLVKQYGEKDVSVSELVQKQIDKAKRNGRNLTWDEAYEEMVADSMESMLTDGNVVQMMADLKQQDKTLWQKICDWVKNLADDLKELVEAYKGYKPDSPEGKMVADMQDTIVILESIYADALAEASENFQRAEKNTTEDGGVKMQTRSVNGEQVVWIEDNVLKENKGLPVHQFIANYIAEHIGEVYTIIESGQNVHIGDDLPGEYTQSKYTQTILKSNSSISRAKNRASANLGEMIEIATNRRWEKTNHPRSKDAKYGMYRYDTQFGFPVKNPKGDVIGANIYDAELLIRNASDGKKYLYDIVSIKKNTANSAWLTQRVTSAAGFSAVQKGDVSENSIRNNGNNVNKKLSDRDSAKLDRDYMAAVKRGDMETAQRMVDEAAKGAGYTKQGYHGSHADFTVVDGWLWTSRDRDVAKNYYGRRPRESKNNAPNDIYGVYSVRYRLGKNLLIDADSNSWGELPVTEDEYVGVYVNEDGDITTNAMAEWAESHGYDSITFENVYDGGAAATTVDVVFNPNRDAKSTVPVTYDDNGNVIPLSERFNKKNLDIRYSDRDPAAGRVNEVLQNENAKLKEDVQYLKDLVKLQKTVTGGTKFTKTSVEAMAGNLMKANNVKGNKQELAKLLNDLYEYIAKGEELSWDGVKEMAQPAVDWLRKNTVIKSELSEYAREILHDVRTSRISLDESQTAEAAYRYGSYNEYRKAMMGSVIISKDGVPLDIQWQEWASTYPDIFDANITASDMPNALADAISSLRNSDLSRAEYAYHADMIEQDLLQQVYDGYWRVSTLYTVADVKQREINALKGKHRQKMNDLRQFHREKTDQLKQEHRDEVKRIRKEYREDSQKKQQEIIQRYQDSRKRSVENRNKTAMRHKIQNVVKELNSLLLTNDKKRHVPDNLKKPVEEALKLLNMDTVDAENRAAKYADLIAKEQAKANPDQDKIDSYTMTMENILRQGEKMGQRIKELHAAYEEIRSSDDPDIANAYDPVIAGAIQELSATIGNTSIKNMTMDQLSDVYDVYRAVLTRVRDANKAMAENIRASIEELAKSTIREVQTVGGSKKYRVSNLDAVRKFDWNNMKPVYAMERIGSSTLTEVFNNVRAGEDTWAKDISEAREYYLEKSKKYGYDKWDFDKKYRFESNSGIPFELTLEQILSLYAYSKREQAADHLRLGGFVFDSNIETYKEKDGKKSLLKYKVNTADAHQITPEIMADIIGKLSKEQAGFVDEMQDYLSTVMGAKGNEVTSKMYGVKLFKEKFYFPLKSAKQFMFEQNEVSGEVRIKNSGFTNKVVAKANNPVILSNFMDVWSGHVNDMSMYHAFTLPLEDFNRVFNYNSPKRDGVESVSVKGTIQDAYSPAAVSYVKQLITDLNGGARTDSTTGVINKLTGMFKKGAVFASLSVVVQQPSAIARAAALVDTKYFIGPKVDQKRHKYLWAEVKKYAPVAIIKEMGYFDTNMGKSTQDFITGKEYSGIGEKAKAVVTDSAYRDELLSKAPALADEYAWCGIWAAVKRETKAKHPSMDTTSEAFLKLCGKRFTEVITKTQVYDSVLARSANMRSKDTGMKMATAFMAEPTTSINMIEDAIWKAKRGDKKYAGKAIGAVIASQILNSILVSFVYAGRDDDEDETYAEKYIGALTGSLVDGLNVATYIPFIKDIVSIMQGYDVERSDMAVVSDLWNAWKNLKNDKVSPYRKVENFAGSIAQIFGLPVKNIMRDVRGIYNTITNLAGAEQTTGSGVKYAISGAITGKTVSDKEQLYKARLDGDKQHAARVAARYDDDDSADAAVRAAIKDSFMADEIDEATAVKHMVLYAGMDGSEAHWTMDAWKYRKKVGSDEGYGKYGKFHDAVRSGKNLESVIKEYTDNGVKASTLTGEITEEFKPVYLEASNSEKAAMKTKLISAYVACDMEREDAEKKLESWDFEAEYGFAYSDRKETYLSGKVSKATLVDILIDRGYDEEDAEAQVEAYEWEAAGFEDVTTSAIRNYNEWCEPVGIPKSVYLEFWRFDNSTENDVDKTTGKPISYSAVKKIMAYINSLNLTDRQKDALAKSTGWADKTIKKYKLW